MQQLIRRLRLLPKILLFQEGFAFHKVAKFDVEYSPYVPELELV